MILIQQFLHWLGQNPVGAATLFYITGVAGVLIYSYFEPRDQY
ncbi:MAG: hypothetical protein RL768_1895 [Nitrospirota bacterium]|jgi:uncharacterized membrane protein